MVEGRPVETQFTTPYRDSRLPRRRSGGATRTAPSRRRAQGIAESREREWPRDHLRLFRLGMRAAADRAEVARARRDGAAERAAIEDGDEHCGPRSAPFVVGRFANRTGLAADEIEAEVATTEAEHRRLRREPADATWAEARARWDAAATPTSLRTAAGARPRHASTTATGPVRRRHSRTRTPSRRAWARRRSARRSKGSPRGPGSTSPARRRRPRPSRPSTRERPVRADPARARRPAAPRQGTDEPPDRRGAVHQREHGRRPRLEHPGQARRNVEDRGGRHRGTPRSRSRGLTVS